MSPFIVDLLITLAIWAGIAMAAWLSVRGARRGVRHIRRHPAILKWIFMPILFVCIIGLSVGSGWVAQAAVALCIILFIPFAIVLVIQLAFMTYHWFAHGDAFYQPGVHDDRTVIFIAEGRKRLPKYCPICKRNTFCKLSPPGSPIPFHIIRG